MFDHFRCAVYDDDFIGRIARIKSWRGILQLQWILIFYLAIYFCELLPISVS